MNKGNWTLLEAMLEKHSFKCFSAKQSSSLACWYVCDPLTSDVFSCLRFVYKPKLQVLTTHLGWHHKDSSDFCLTALKADWPEGFSWLTEAGVLDAPCLSLFNLAGHLSWPLGGMPLGDRENTYENAVIKLDECLSDSNWWRIDTEGLFFRYVEDAEPFRWRSCNSAIRLAQIAGLCALYGNRTEVFEQCASAYSVLIEADMCGLGRASTWIAALRERLGQHRCLR